MSSIRFAGETLRELRQFLMAEAPEEVGTFALLGQVGLDGEDPDYVVRSLVLPHDSADWESKGADWLTPTTTYINRAAVLADSLGLGLAFVHSHPSRFHPAGLSLIDQSSTAKLFANLRAILGEVPLASLVFTPTSFAGLALRSEAVDKPSRLAAIKVIGPQLESWSAADSPTPSVRLFDANAFSRQVLALGEAGQSALSGLRVGIVGAGGTGSALAEQLVRLGVRDFVIVDDDRLSRSNISRTYGATAADARLRRYKVDVAARNILRIARTSRVRAIRASVTTAAGLEPLKGLDIVFGCTDTDGSRASLNDLSYRCFVPVVDMGCRIETRGREVTGLLGRVRYLRPGLPCLWCTGTIDGNRVLLEALSPEERARLAASGYGSGIGPQPSVIHLTSLVASLAVAELLTVVLGVPNAHDGCWTALDLAQPYITRVQSQTEHDCRCTRLTGLGDRGRVLR